jgi:hypothetical protein
MTKYCFGPSRGQVIVTASRADGWRYDSSSFVPST